MKEENFVLINFKSNFKMKPKKLSVILKLIKEKNLLNLLLVSFIYISI